MALQPPSRRARDYQNVWLPETPPVIGRWYPIGPEGMPSVVTGFLPETPDLVPWCRYRVLQTDDLVKVPASVLKPKGRADRILEAYVGRCLSGEVDMVLAFPALIFDVRFTVPAQELCDVWNEWQEPNFLGEGI